MITAIIIIALLLVILGLYTYLKIQAKNKSKVILQEVEVKAPKITYLPIKKEDSNFKNSNQEFEFDISSVTKRNQELDILITFQNNSTKHVRIEIKKVTFNYQNNDYNGDFDLKFMTMGTNDIILKNTILSGGNLIRNIYFTDNDFELINGNDFLTVELLINNEPFILTSAFNSSTAKEIKIIEE